jgi:hypothetical protein
MPHSKSGLARKLKALRKRGWSEAKIERWLAEQSAVAAREERIHPLPPWGDEISVEAEEQLLAKYSDRAWALDFFDHQTALTIIDEAEKAGLVIQPSELAKKRTPRRQPTTRTHSRWLRLVDEAWGRQLPARRSSCRCAGFSAGNA